MDEPLSNLDARLRVQMRTEIARLQRELEITTVYVTHDQVEAMTMADRVAVLRDGVLQQFDTPHGVYSTPANVFVASFIGSPAMNLVEATLRRGEKGVGCLIGSHTVPIPDRVLADQPTLSKAIGTTVAVGIRPESISLADGDGDGLPGTVVVSEELGSEVISHIEVDAVSVRGEAVRHRRAAEVVGLETAVTEPQNAKTVMIARLPAQAGEPRGTRLSLAFDANKLHFFDLSTGETLRTR